MITAGVVYYTNNNISSKIMKLCQDKLKDAIGDRKLVSVSWKPIDFGENIVVTFKKTHNLAIFKQILIGLEALDTDCAFLVEHDVLYHPSHFDFVFDRKDAYYYNVNVWSVRYSDGFAIKFPNISLSQICSYRETLILGIKRRIDYLVSNSTWKIREIGYEPGRRLVSDGGVDDYGIIERSSIYPNIDIRDHGTNMTHTLWSQSKNILNWEETYDIPYWGRMSFK